MYSAIFIGLIAVFFTFLYDRKIWNNGFIISMGILTIFCAIRWEWGSDMPVYARDFEMLELDSLKLKDLMNIESTGYRNYEYGWLILNLLCQPIGFFGMTILLSIFEGCVIYWFIKKYVPSGYFTYAVFIYAFDSNLMVLGCSMMRQWLAMCIILIAIDYAINNRTIPFLIIVFIASLFHSSALFCIVFYFIRLMRNFKITLQRLSLLFMIIILWVYVFGHFFETFATSFILDYFSRYEYYVLSGEETSTVGFASLFNIVIASICLYYVKNSNNSVKTITWIYLTYTIILPFVTLIPMASRIIFYFNILGIVTIPNGVRNIKNNTIKYGVIMWIIFWNTYTFINFFYSPVWHKSYIEYHTIFESPYWK